MDEGSITLASSPGQASITLSVTCAPAGLSSESGTDHLQESGSSPLISQFICSEPKLQSPSTINAQGIRDSTLSSGTESSPIENTHSKQCKQCKTSPIERKDSCATIFSCTSAVHSDCVVGSVCFDIQGAGAFLSYNALDCAVIDRSSELDCSVQCSSFSHV